MFLKQAIIYFWLIVLLIILVAIVSILARIVSNILAELAKLSFRSIGSRFKSDRH